MKRLTKETSVSTRFDYEVLDPEQRHIVQRRTAEIRERLQRSAQDIWEIGQGLAEVRSQLKHGQFDAWLKAEFGWSRRLAYNFINVYERFPERANLAQVNIATSALYLLAAPSTPQPLRDKYLQQARNGEKVTHQDLRQAIQAEQSQSASKPVGVASSNPGTVKPEIITLVPKATAELATPTAVEQESEEQPEVATTLSIQRGWYRLGTQHLLFCGDTASPDFFKRVPEDALALAITSNDWDHDWLIDRARKVIILSESDFKEKLIEQLLSVLSSPGEAVIFPWLPTGKLVAVAHELGRRIYAGDPNPERCSEAIAESGLKAEKLGL